MRSNLVVGSEFFLSIILVCKKKAEVSIYSYKQLPKVVVDYFANPLNGRLGRR